MKSHCRVCRSCAAKLALFLFAALTVVSCGKSRREEPPDHPRLTPGVKMIDVTFHSAALDRDMQYRTILPANVAGDQKFPVLYLLHGGGGGFHDWSNYSDVAQYAGAGLILIMPEGHSSYYMNSAEHPQERYEDYIVHDLIEDAERRFPVAGGRSNRAIAGLSMGGFGAIVLALKHPDLFVFAGGLSSALDVPGRPFSIRRYDQWRHHKSIFGAWGSQSRHDNDPLVLARSTDPAKVPIFFSLAVNRRACCRRTADLPHCCSHAGSPMSSTPVLEVMTGTSGTGACLI